MFGLPGSGVRLAALRHESFVCHDSLCMERTVLIVDDHPSFRMSARAVLEADGFEIVGEAEDGATALAANRALRPDVVLLDVQLPDANGWDLCQFLCEIQPRPAIVLVSSRDASDFDGLVELGPARGFIAKADLSGDALRAALA
jgi:DNA-binding NarL/FixJ family response regulator